MSEMIAYCGLVCTSCLQYIATQNDDNNAREEIAKQIADKFGLHYKPEEINCDGCLSSEDRHIGFCNTVKSENVVSKNQLKTVQLVMSNHVTS